jgi:cysteine desulfurase/selenocysteine lyase
LSKIEGLKIFGESTKKAAVVSFEVKGIHNFDLGTLLDQQGIAVRTGHHCTQPLWQRFRVEGAVRVSLCFYNTIEEIDAFILALKKSIKMLS